MGLRLNGRHQRQPEWTPALLSPSHESQMNVFDVFMNRCLQSENLQLLRHQEATRGALGAVITKSRSFFVVMMELA